MASDCSSLWIMRDGTERPSLSGVLEPVSGLQSIIQSRLPQSLSLLFRNRRVHGAEFVSLISDGFLQISGLRAAAGSIIVSIGGLSCPSPRRFPTLFQPIDNFAKFTTGSMAAPYPGLLTGLEISTIPPADSGRRGLPWPRRRRSI